MSAPGDMAVAVVLAFEDGLMVKAGRFTSGRYDFGLVVKQPHKPADYPTLAFESQVEMHAAVRTLVEMQERVQKNACTSREVFVVCCSYCCDVMVAPPGTDLVPKPRGNTPTRKVGGWHLRYPAGDPENGPARWELRELTGAEVTHGMCLPCAALEMEGELEELYNEQC